MHSVPEQNLKEPVEDWMKYTDKKFLNEPFP